MIVIGLIMLVAGIWSTNAIYRWFKRDYATDQRKAIGLTLTVFSMLMAAIGCVLTAGGLAQL